MTPDALLVGHVVKDITDDGWRAGGSVLYGAAQCAALGLQAAVVSRWAEGAESPLPLSGVQWRILPDITSTVFINRYAEGVRSQELLSSAQPLDIDDIPADWQAAPIVMLMPVFHDVAPELVQSFACAATLLAVTAQGWLRKLDITKVKPADQLPDGRQWQGADLLFVSEEDVATPEAVAEWSAYVPTVVLTRGRRGSTVWSDGRRIDIPAIAVEEVDPTGAGDVFATAFTVRYHETGDPVAAGQFATAAAALAVQGIGTTAIAGREELTGLLAREAIRSQ